MAGSKYLIRIVAGSEYPDRDRSNIEMMGDQINATMGSSLPPACGYTSPTIHKN
jgi:hypothetical protein